MSCTDGKYLNSGSCLECDKTKCATCVTSSDNCLTACNDDCATCDIEGKCLSCEVGKYLDTDSGSCLEPLNYKVSY